MLVKGQTGHSKVPKDRYDAEAWYHPNHERRGARSLLARSAAEFDAPFFSITAKEAAGMDPMQPGMPLEDVASSQTGVYAGSMTDDYAHISAADELDLPQNSASGISRAMLANRVSWFFNLHGPSITLDTACSSSLYALHLACQSLRMGETKQALVCGANLVLSPNYVTQLSAMHMVGPDGVSHSFDARANGYARGEAVGAAVVKTLRQAVADGDTVRAVVRGTGANQDGRTAGITVPSGRAQEALIRQTYALANLPLDGTGYFEAHGTGTRAGDPVELGALHATFGAARGRGTPLLVGSVNTNIGHTEGAAGIAGIIKAVLTLERAQIPPLAGFDTLNPSLQHLVEDGAIVLPRHTQPWPDSSSARRASVNSFGFGGANAHAILDDAFTFLLNAGCGSDNTRINEPRFCQPVCSILQFVLVDLLRHWGITPKATVGHSSGELASAYAARSVRFEDAVRIAYYRGVYCEAARHRRGSRRGTMLAAAVSEAEAHEYLALVPEDSAWIGCINSPSSVTLSGDVESIDRLDAILRDRGNSVTGELVECPASIDAVFWTTNMLASVKFNAAVGKLLSHQTHGRRKEPIRWTAAVEIGPHGALKGPFKQIAAAWSEKGSADIPYTSILSRNKHCVQTAKAAAGLLWAVGHPVNLAAVNDEDRKANNLKVVTTLPPYTWNHEKGFWHEPAIARAARLRTRPRSDLLGVPMPSQDPTEPMWRNFLCSAESPWLNENVITGTTLFPAAGMLPMAIEAAFQMSSTERGRLSAIRFHNVHLDKGLVIPSGDQAVEVFLSIKKHETLDDWFHFKVLSLRSDGSWDKHSTGEFNIMYKNGGDTYAPPSREWATHRETFYETTARATDIDPRALYDQLQGVGIQYGPLFRNVVSAAGLSDQHRGVATISAPDTRSSMPHGYEYLHLIHPATLDAIFHLVYVAMRGRQPVKEAAIPQSIGELFISADLPQRNNGRFTGYSHVAPTGARGFLGSIFVSDEHWQEPKVIVRNMVMTKVSSTAPGEARQLARPKRVAQIFWKEDFEHLIGSSVENVMAARSIEYRGTESRSAAAELSVCLDLLCHKLAVEVASGFVPSSAPPTSPSASLVTSSRDRSPSDIASGYNSLRSVEDSLDLLMQLLAPGGYLAIIGHCSPSCGMAEWGNLVTKKGFGRVITAVDHPDSMLLITSIPGIEELVSDVVLLERSFPSETVKLLAAQLSEQLVSIGTRLFQKLVSSAHYLLWVTGGGFSCGDESSLRFAPTTGLLRSLRVEKPHVSLPHLDLSPDIILAGSKAASLITAAFKSTVPARVNGRATETEYNTSDGLLLIPRVISEESLNQELELHSPSVRGVAGRLDDGYRHKLVASGPNGVGSFRWVQDEDSTHDLKDCEVEVRVSHVLLDSVNIQDSFDNGETPTLGRQAIAAHSFGHAVIQLVQMFEGHVIVSVSSQAEKRVLTDNYNIPETSFLGTPGSFTIQDLATLTDGRGVDIIIGSSSGVAFRHLSACLGDGGRFVDVCRMAISSDLDPDFFTRNASFSSVNLDTLAQHKVFEAVEKIFQLTHTSRSIAEHCWAKTYSVAEIDTALASVRIFIPLWTIDGDAYNREVCGLKKANDNKPQDSIFENMTYGRWCATINPKVKGTWNLHSLFPRELDFFVILSSMSGVIGNAGQSNYCAGNTYEDSVAHYRRSIGLAAISLDVGLVTDASHFEKGSTFDSTSEEYLKKYKHWTSAQVTSQELEIVLAAAIRGTSFTNGEPFAPQLLVGITDDIQRSTEPGWSQDRKFDQRVSQSVTNDSPGAQEVSTGQKMRSAQTVNEAAQAVEEALRTNIAASITAEPDDIDVSKALFTFGIDSLKAIEVRNWIFAELKADVSVFDVLSQTPISDMAFLVVGRSSLVSDETKRAAVVY
ncbi:hypothetical protein LY76DRAFT_661041 [Colletotrichum caudatum]|nr:hypothetical protein LY76DRAFT_661041 [Colletotrichum caudatum]